MKWKVQLYVGGSTFYEEVHAVNRNDAIETAKARNPKAINRIEASLQRSIL